MEIIIKYEGGQFDWADCSHINPVTSSGQLSVTMNDSTVVVLKTYPTQQDGIEAKAALETRIAQGGSGTIIIEIDDL